MFLNVFLFSLKGYSETLNLLGLGRIRLPNHEVENLQIEFKEVQ